MHAMETAWLPRMRSCRLYAYEFDPASFELKFPEAGYWVARSQVVPLSVLPVGDLLALHAEAGIELRTIENLWPVIDAIVASRLEFSIIRKGNARPRERQKDSGVTIR
jgi:hypothetical protein